LIDAVSTSVEQVDFTTPVPRNPLLSYNYDNQGHDIKEFLSRPIVCPAGNISWTTIMANGSNIFNMLIPTTMIGPGTVWGDKLEGFLGFKGTFCFKVQFSAQRFQSGIALVSILPAAEHIAPIRLGLVESDILYKSQLPSVRFNIAELNEVEIKVPFISPELFYSRNNPRNWAKVYIDVYSALLGGDLTGLCWCWFEDVELFHAMAQSGFTTSNKSKRKVAYQDIEDTGRAPISQPLSTFSRAFGQVAANIPFLSAVARPASWFLDAVSKSVASFGYGSTVDTSFRKAVVYKSLPHANNCDTNDTSDSLGLFVSNKVSQMPGFAGTNIDEMALQYLVQIPCYMASFSWAKTDTYYTMKYNLWNGPSTVVSSKTVTPSTGAPIPTYRFGPAGYISTSFAFWRGTMKYRFYINKTDFHTGRLLFTFSAGYGVTNPTPVAAIPFVYKWIWDIEDSYSFEISIPYVGFTPWTPTTLGASGSTGLLQISVLTPLNGPSTVSSTAEIVVEGLGGEDLEFGGFETPTQNFAPIMAYSGDVNPNRIHSHRQRYYSDPKKLKQDRLNSRKKFAIDVDKKRKFKYDSLNQREDAGFAQGPLVVQQSATEAHFSEPSTEFGSTSKDFDSVNAHYTIGECVRSIKQMLKRTSYIYSRQMTAVEVALRFDPTIPYIETAFQGGARVEFPAGTYSDYFTKFSSMYALQRGGFIIRSLSSGDGLSYHTLKCAGTAIAAFFASTAGVNNIGSHTESRIATINKNQGAVDALVPYYSRTVSSPVIHPVAYNAPTTDVRSYCAHQQLTIYTNSTIVGGLATTQFLVGRRVADDFSLGGFIGTIPLRIADVTFP
jgi:hypothetical protein